VPGASDAATIDTVGSYTVAISDSHRRYATGVTVLSAADGVSKVLAGGINATEGDVLSPAAAPAISLTAGQTFTGTVASFADTYAGNTAGDFAATIAWGDGTTSAGTIVDTNGTIAVSGSHLYAAAGTDQVSVTLTDLEGTATATATGTATITAMPRSYGGTGASLATTEGTPVTATLASFTDSNTADAASNFSATIAWGDGTTSTGTVSGSNGSFTVTGTGHAYADEGSFATKITVLSAADGVATVLTGGVTAGEADLLAASGSIALSGVAGTAVNGVVAHFTDSNVAATATAGDLAATITWGDGTTSVGTVAGSAGAFTVSGSHAYAAAGTDAVSVTLTDTDGTATATAGGTASIAAPTSGAFYLTTKEDHLTGGAGNDTFVALTNTLSTNDALNGGGGVNTLLLSGGGTFNLALVDQLNSIQIVAAQEGAGAAAQTVTLRENTSLTVNVAADPAHSPAAGITIIGAQNTDVINLGPGNDTIVVGVGETVNGGGGNATYKVNQDTIKNTINGGSTGTNTLVLTTGGSLAMGTAVTGMTNVQLTTATKFTANATAGMAIAGNAAGGDTIVLGAASQSVISGGANELVKAASAFAGAQVSGLGTGSTLEITSGGTVKINAATQVGTVKLDAATNLQLNGMQFMAATGSSGADTILAGAANQTLTGGSGADTLVGAASGYDTFSDKASGLNGDLVRGFLATDQIDITDIAFAGATLKAVSAGVNTQVMLTAAGGAKASFLLEGTFGAAGFKLATDGHTGTFITHT